MKTKLLLLLACLPMLSNAQINSYYGGLSAMPTDGLTSRSYFQMASATPLDQSAVGENIAWNFDQLTPSGFSWYNNAAPTAEELSTYPNTTRVITNVSGAGSATTRAFISNDNNTIQLTGAELTGLTLNYNANNAKIGTLPMAFGYSSTDISSGTYVYGGYSGTFAGTITTTVDASGTLQTNDPNWYGGPQPVLRMKTVQELALNYAGFGTVGNVTQTTYEYHFFDGSMLASYPVFKTATTHLLSPLLSIDETTTTLEQAFFVFLQNEQFEAKSVFVSPNPVNGQLTIQIPDHAALRQVQISDNRGRIVKSENGDSRQIDVGPLQNGVYFVKITTDKGSAIRKIIKN